MAHSKGNKSTTISEQDLEKVLTKIKLTKQRLLFYNYIYLFGEAGYTVPRYTCGYQRVTFRNQFPPSRALPFWMIAKLKRNRGSQENGMQIEQQVCNPSIGTRDEGSRSLLIS